VALEYADAITDKNREWTTAGRAHATTLRRHIAELHDDHRVGNRVIELQRALRIPSKGSGAMTYQRSARPRPQQLRHADSRAPYLRRFGREVDGVQRANAARSLKEVLNIMERTGKAGAGLTHHPRTRNDQNWRSGHYGNLSNY